MSSKKKSGGNIATSAPVNTDTRTAAPAEQATQAPDFIDKLGKAGPMAVLGLLALMAFWVYRHYLVGDNLFFFKDIGSDTWNYNYPTNLATTLSMKEHGWPTWSFARGMGQSFYPFFLRDPFDIILYLGGPDNVASLTAWKEYLKVVLGGFLFFRYLKTVGLTGIASTAGAMLFSFCGFMILGGTWLLFSFEAFNLALLLLAFEQFLVRGKWLLFPVAIFFIGISQPFNLFVYGLFLAAYAVLRMYQVGGYDVKKGAIVFLQMAGLGVLGIMLSGFTFIENIVQLLESPRGSGTTSYAATLSAVPMFQLVDQYQFGTAIMRFFSSDMLGSGTAFKGWMNTLEAPLFYCGIPCLLLMPQVFPTLKGRVRIAFIAFIAIWMLPVFFPYFRYAFWLFSGDYYRGYSMIVAAVFMYYSLVALDVILRERRVNLPILAISAVLMLLLLNYPFFPEGEFINSPIYTFASFILIVYAVLLFLMGRAKSPAYLPYIFLGAMAFELVYFSSTSVNEREPVTKEELTQKGGYNDGTKAALAAATAGDKSFYRVDKAFASSPAMHYSLNDALAQGFRGTSGYNPFNQLYYIRYLQLMGISDKKSEHESRWARGTAGRPILESQNRVKYFLDRGFNMPIWRVIADSIGIYDGISVFRNKLLLPFGYCYSKYIKESVFDQLSVSQKDFVSLQACVVADDNVASVKGMEEFRLSDTIQPQAFNLDVYAQKVAELGKESMTGEQINDTHVSGKVTTTAPRMLYLSMPYDGGWTLKVDGKATDKQIVFAGMTGVSLPAGTHTIELNYGIRYLNTGWMMTIAGLVACAGLWVFTRRKPQTAL